MTYKIITEVPEEKTPEGKRSIRRTAYGVIKGYVSGKFWKELGEAFFELDEEYAQRWVEGKED